MSATASRNSGCAAVPGLSESLVEKHVDAADVLDCVERPQQRRDRYDVGLRQADIVSV